MLDFIILGGQKCGTSTLHEVLKDHPSILLPNNKEAPYFLGTQFQEKHWDRFYRDNYKQKQERKIVGKITPQYLSDPDSAYHIYSHNPNINLIVILRNPIDRVYSHYKMCYRRGLTSSPFEQKVIEWISHENLRKSRDLQSFYKNEAECCVAWSEYCRQLNHYLPFFPRNNTLVIFTDTLANSPNILFESIFQFLEIDPTFTSDKIGKVFFKGGLKDRLDWAKPAKNLPLTKTLWRLFLKLLPKSILWEIEKWRAILKRKFRAKTSFLVFQIARP